MKILDIKIDNLAKLEIKDKLNSYIKSNNFHQIATVNPEFIIESLNNKKFKQILNQCDLNLVDGFGLKIAGLLNGNKIKYRFPGVDLIQLLANLCEQNNCSMLLLGGIDGVGERAKKKLLKQFPKLNISVISGGKIYYHQEKKIWQEDQYDINKIKKLKPDIILVALGSPKQELWIHDHKKILLNTKIAIGVGGSFDYISGDKIRPPKIIIKLGLEWLYRIIIEPFRANKVYNASFLTRWKRTYNATFKFIYYIIKDLICFSKIK